MLTWVGRPTCKQVRKFLFWIFEAFLPILPRAIVFSRCREGLLSLQACSAYIIFSIEIAPLLALEFPPSKHTVLSIENMTSDGLLPSMLYGFPNLVLSAIKINKSPFSEPIRQSTHWKPSNTFTVAAIWIIICSLKTTRCNFNPRILTY